MDDSEAVIAITVGLDRQAVEALQLEIRRLAKRAGVDIKALRIERLPEEPGDPSG